MATDGAKQLEMMTKSLRLFSEDMQRVEKTSKGIADNMTELGWQIKNNHRSFMEYVGHALRLPPILREASKALIASDHTIKASIAKYEDELRIAKSIVAEQQLIVRQRKLAGASQDSIKAARIELTHAKSIVAEQQAALNLEQKRLSLRQNIANVTGKNLAIEYLLIRGFTDAIHRSGELNKSLIAANSLSETRQELTQQIYEVQAKTGASFQHMNEAAKALTMVWPKAQAGFKSTLEVMVQMEEGLGVSFESSAQLARVFEINLKTSVRDVADQIAVIANNTSLAADEATRFATEVGKALRLLGPGAAPGAKEATGYITLMAARMKDVGGDASEIVKLFNEMTKGTQQAFMLRGLSGVNTPGALGTGQGAQAAMQGLGQMIDKIVTAKPGTMAYAAQLEAAAQIMGTSTETVRLYKEMLKEANKPLDEHAKLQQRWREQVNNANQALIRVRESFISLLQQAFMPLMPVIKGLFGILAQFVSFLASNKITVYLATAAIVAAAIKTVWSLGRLTVALYQVAAASAAATKFTNLRNAMQLELPMGGGPKGGGGITSLLAEGKLASTIKGALTAEMGKDPRWLTSFRGWLANNTAWSSRIPAALSALGTRITGAMSIIPKWFPGITAWFSRIYGAIMASRAATMVSGLASKAGFASLLGSFAKFGRFLVSGPALAVVAAGAAGVAMGLYIDKKWPDNWIAQAARAIGDATVKKSNYANMVQPLPGQKTADQVMNDVRKQMLKGNWDEAEKMFRTQAFKTQGLVSEKAAQGYIDRYKKTAAEVREKIALSSVTSNEAAVLDNDRKMIELTKEGIKNTGGAAKLLKDANDQRKTMEDLRRADSHKEKMVKATEFRMLQQESLAKKGSAQP